MRAAVKRAVDRARTAGCPTLIEAKTYRYRGHSRTDPASYRPAGELDQWRERDPIELLGTKLAAGGALSSDEQTALRKELQQQIDDSAARAGDAPLPTLETMETYVYAH